MHRHLLDKFLVFYISPAAGLLVAVSQVSAFNYFLTGYATSLVLVLFLLHRMTWNVPAAAFMPILMIAMICMIEFVHYGLTGLALNDMHDIRMVLYNPLYSPIIIFLLYATYLLVASKNIRKLHLQISIKFITFFNIIFIFYWMALYTGLVPEIDDTAFLNANSMSYSGLFVILVLIISKGSIAIRPQHIKYYLLINTLVILLNTTRGALLILLTISSFKILRIIYRKTNGSLITVGTLALAASGSFLILTTDVIGAVFGSQFSELYGTIRSIQQHSSLEITNFSFSGTGDFDGPSLSSISRIFTNFLAFLFFLDSPLIGIGSTKSLSIEVLESGIHSFLFLLLSSTGIFGVIIFLAAVRSIARRMGKGNCGYILFLFAALVLLFTNQLPTYFVLLFVVNAVSGHLNDQAQHHGRVLR